MAYIETLFTYVHDVAQTRLTGAFCYACQWDFMAHNTLGDTTKCGYQAQWKLTYKSAEIEIVGHFHVDLCNVHGNLFPGVEIQFIFTKSKSELQFLSTRGDTRAFFRFLDVTLHVKHVKLSPTIQLAYAKVFEKLNDRYDMNRMVLKTSNSMSIEKAVLGIFPHAYFSSFSVKSISRDRRTLTLNILGISVSTTS